MAATIGWYGPLIDLCKASSYIGDYTQLLVFVHKSTPIQYKIARNGGELVRMDILVGDETRSYFPVTIWQRHMSSQILAGHIFLLQNVKITKFGEAVEARALHCSTFQCLLNPMDFVSTTVNEVIWECLMFNAIRKLMVEWHTQQLQRKHSLDDKIRKCRLGITARDKLEKVVAWLQRARLAHCGSVLNCYEHMSQLKVNWKLHEELRSQDCSSLFDLYECKTSCKATFHASVGEIFLPISWMNLSDTEAERMFISRRIHILGGNNLVDDFITTGCQLCGTPMNAGHEYSVEQNAIPLYCKRSSNRLHVVGTIYRPFLLYVWDDLKYLPISVTNKAAEFLFGSISAEKIFSSYKSQCRRQTATGKCHSCKVYDTRENATNSHSGADHNNPSAKGGMAGDDKPNFCVIWLILLRILFEHGKNSPLRFKVMVHPNQDWETGKLEMISVSMPAFRKLASS